MTENLHKSKIVLGTVQFGLDYGINNRAGKVSQSEVDKILEFAYKNGVRALDSAYNYGESEKVIGQFIRKSGLSFNIISKVPKTDEKSIQKYLDTSLKNLGVKKLYGYLFHAFDSFKENPKLLDELIRLKKESKINKIGFSLYYPEELEYLIENKIVCDIVQVPYSLLDQRFDRLFPTAKELGIEIHTRSVFLQGLVFKDPESLETRFLPIKKNLLELRELGTKTGLSISELCLNFAAVNPHIDRLVIGVDSLANLADNVDSLLASKAKLAEGVYTQLANLRCDDEEVILPTNWK